MKVAELLEKRHQNWRELERLCDLLETKRKSQVGAESIARFGALYRSACADLALADSYQLPPNTVNYLHHLVGRAHNQLYRSRTFNFSSWVRELLFAAPQRILRNKCLWLAAALFWGVFLVSMALAYGSPGYAEQVLTKEMMTAMEDMYSQPMTGRGANEDVIMVGFYGQHNTSIGLRCYALGYLFGVGGLFELVYNANILGAVFGHMATTSQRGNFFNFVTVHGPFELTAIVLSAAAGMQVGFSLIHTRGLGRIDSLRLAAQESLPTIAAAALLFGGAALIEAFVSPSPLPYPVKLTVAAVSGGLLFFYFVVLGWPREVSVQLDSTRIVVRERNYMDLLDLALCVVRAHFWQLLLAGAAGAIPMILFNLWLVGDRLTDLDVELGTDVFSFVWTLALLFLLELPLAAAPITLYLGQALFQENPSARKIATELAGSLPQMTILQIGPRALLVLPAVVWQDDTWLILCSVLIVLLAFLFCAFWPYLGEVILLERNPLFRWSGGGMSTLGRSISLHARNAGDLFGHWMLAMILGGTWIVGLWLALDFVITTVSGSADLGATFYTVYLQTVVWIVAGFFSVVRFLSYLDLRIKNEGWEIELRMRAEAARLTRPMP